MKSVTNFHKKRWRRSDIYCCPRRTDARWSADIICLI